MHILQSGEINAANGAVLNIFDKSLMLLIKLAGPAKTDLARGKASGFWQTKAKSASPRRYGGKYNSVQI